MPARTKEKTDPNRDHDERNEKKTGVMQVARHCKMHNLLLTNQWNIRSATAAASIIHRCRFHCERVDKKSKRWQKTSEGSDLKIEADKEEKKKKTQRSRICKRQQETCRRKRSKAKDTPRRIDEKTARNRRKPEQAKERVAALR